MTYQLFHERTLRFVALASTIAIIVGCNDGKPVRVPISGTVLIDGQPLKMGSIMFAPEGQRPAGGSIGADGRYTLSCYERGDGAVIGQHTVTVTAAENISETAVRWHAPKKYSEIKSSGLEVTVDGPKDDLNIELTWSGGKPFVEQYGQN